jgi:hypothetical protein
MLTVFFYELESLVKYGASQSPPPRFFLSSFRSWNWSVRSPGTPWACLFSFATEDPDLDSEHAPVVLDTGTIELRTFRCRTPHGLRMEETTEYKLKSHTHRLHQGRVSERSKQAGWHHVRYYKQAGWHHVRYYNSQITCPILIHVLIHTALQKR